MASLASQEVQALRFALRFSPPTLVLEYTRGGDARKRVSKFQLRKLKHSSNPQKIVRGLQRKCAKYLGPSIVSTEQLTRLVVRLIEQLNKDAAARSATRDDSTKENVGVGNQESGTQNASAESVVETLGTAKEEEERGEEPEQQQEEEEQEEEQQQQQEEEEQQQQQQEEEEQQQQQQEEEEQQQQKQEREEVRDDVAPDYAPLNPVQSERMDEISEVLPEPTASVIDSTTSSTQPSSTLTSEVTNTTNKTEAKIDSQEKGQAQDHASSISVAATITTTDPAKISEQDDEDAFDDLLGDILGSDYSDDSFMEDEDEAFGMDGQVDLNKVSEGDLDRAKKNMNNAFLKNRIRPGDEGYEFDKRVEFSVDEAAGSDCSWDESDDDDE